MNVTSSLERIEEPWYSLLVGRLAIRVEGLSYRYDIARARDGPPATEGGNLDAHNYDSLPARGVSSYINVLLSYLKQMMAAPS